MKYFALFIKNKIIRQLNFEMIIALMFVGVFLCWHGYALSPTTYTLRWDSYDIGVFFMRWLGSASRNGELGDIFPNIVSGFPIGLNSMAGVHHPIFRLAAFIWPSNMLGTNVLFFAHLMMLLYLCVKTGRITGLTIVPAVFFAVSFLSSGFINGHHPHAGFIFTTVGMVGILYSILLCKHAKPLKVATISFLATLHVFLCGYPGLIISMGIPLVIMFLFYLIRAERKQIYFILMLSALSATVLALPQLYGFYTLIELSGRANSLTNVAYPLPLSSLWNLLNPVKEYSDIDPTMKYFGVLFSTTPLIILYLFLPKRFLNSNNKPLIFLFFLWTIFALHKNSPIPLLPLIADYIPFFRFSRYPSAEYRGLALFILAYLSAHSLQIISRMLNNKKFFMALLYLLLLIDLGWVLHKSLWIRYVPTSLKDRLIFKVIYEKNDQYLLDTPRNCSAVNQEVNAMANGLDFFASGYTGASIGEYNTGRSEVAFALCGPSRFWNFETREPAAYSLEHYSPSRIKFSTRATGKMLWSEYTDGNWRLYINNNLQAFTKGPAGLRYFTILPGQSPAVIEMIYMGPYSRFWRRPSQ